MKKHLSISEISKYPKSVILAAIERRLLLTLYDMEQAQWHSETQAALADMDDAIEAGKLLGTCPADADLQTFLRHAFKVTENHEAFDRAQARIDAANKRWEAFKDA